MVFFLTAALYASARYLWTDDERLSQRCARRDHRACWRWPISPSRSRCSPSLPLLGMLGERARRARNAAGSRSPRRSSRAAARPLRSTTGASASHAEWHWASGITQLHVLPALRERSPVRRLRAQARAVRESSSDAARHDARAGRLSFCDRGRFCCLGMARAARRSLWGWLAGGLALRLRRRHGRARRLLHAPAPAARALSIGGVAGALRRRAVRAPTSRPARATRCSRSMPLVASS